MNDRTAPSSAPSLWTLVAVLAAVIALWAASGLLLFPEKERGTFGDMFGAINALFSGLAFASLVYTIFLQRTELQLQREELAETRRELEGQKIQLAAQNDTLRIQNFESAFFQTLRVLNDIVNSIDMGTVERPVKGRDCYRRLYGYLKKSIGEYRKTTPEPEEVLCSSGYADFYEKYGHEIGHYFRTLYNLIKLVHRAHVEDKRYYTNLVRAQLSDPEVALLFYNCISPLGSEKFKPLVEEYALLKNLRPAYLFDQSHLSFYAQSAYGDG
jgi:Putative phage abortive infection protein